MHRSRSAIRPYAEILEDIAETREQLMQPEIATAGDKTVKFNPSHLQVRLRALLHEASKYDPCTGQYRGRRWFRGAACE